LDKQGAMATPALEAVTFNQSAHCRCAHYHASLLNHPIAKLLECTAWIALDERPQIVSSDLLFERKLLREIMA
jgi:hypothetical protein